jgi:hypothetical protein
MRKLTGEIDEARLLSGPLYSTSNDGMNGCFMFCRDGGLLRCIVSDGSDWKAKKLVGGTLPGKPWEHVSVSLESRCPTWEEMNFIKELFWRDDECVVQFHVPKTRHINIHPYCLHLWKPIGLKIPMPPSMCVGPSKEEMKTANQSAFKGLLRLK